MFSVNHTREFDSSAPATVFSASGALQRSQREANNAFLVPQEGSDSNSHAPLQNEQHDLAARFSGSEEDSDSVSRKPQTEKHTTEPVDAEAFALPLFATFMPWSTAPAAEVQYEQPQAQPQNLSQKASTAALAEKSAPQQKPSSVSLPDGFKTVTPEKIQVSVEQKVLDVVSRYGTLDAQKEAGMYRSTSNTDSDASRKTLSQNLADVRSVLRGELPQAVTSAAQNESRKDSASRDKEQAQQQVASLQRVVHSDTAESLLQQFDAPQVEQKADTITSRVTSMQELSPMIMEQMDRLRNSNRKALNLKLELPDGGELAMHLKLVGNSIQVSFDTDSQEIRSSLEEGWPSIDSEARERGVSLASPNFNNGSLLSEPMVYVQDDLGAWNRYA
ncbi:MAG: flagellar hook-length control protein FliK [Opitutales bacterium]|nr:flagellar hook-length control protein FliK [Opitutales bacterium]